MQTTKKIKDKIKKYRKNHRNKPDILGTSFDPNIVREPSLIEINERYPPKRNKK